ncbi:MAG: hypothetical protein ACYCUI_07785 [Vulcanimicrobiaceae bacterium]
MRKKRPGRIPITTLSVQLSREVRAHEARARTTFGVSRRMLFGGDKGAQKVANALKVGRRPQATRIAQRDAQAILANGCWPASDRVWPAGCNLPTVSQLNAFWLQSWALVETVAPKYREPDVELPDGSSRALARDIAPFLAGALSQAAAYPKERGFGSDAPDLRTGRALHELPEWPSVAAKIEEALEFSLRRFEPKARATRKRFETSREKQDAARLLQEEALSLQLDQKKRQRAKPRLLP